MISNLHLHVNAKLLTLKLRWYIDPGHEWLAVPVRALLDSGHRGPSEHLLVHRRGHGYRLP